MCMRPAKDAVTRERRGAGAADAPRFHRSLRNANINYRNGWFFVTWQTAHNKSIFGAIVGDRCELNELGRRVEDYWREMPAKYPELELDEFVVMPNHFHAIVRIRFRPTNREHQLGFLLGRFKGGTGYIYGKMRRAGEVEDIGDHLWQFDYWDKIVTSEQQLAAYRRYIRENPKNWTCDRFGAVTQYSLGNRWGQTLRDANEIYGTICTYEKHCIDCGRRNVGGNCIRVEGAELDDHRHGAGRDPGTVRPDEEMVRARAGHVRQLECDLLLLPRPNREDGLVWAALEPHPDRSARR